MTNNFEAKLNVMRLVIFEGQQGEVEEGRGEKDYGREDNDL